MDDGAVVAVKPYIKHPLQNKWALWFFKNDKLKSWKDNLRLVTSFDTVSFMLYCASVQSNNNKNSLYASAEFKTIYEGLSEAIISFCKKEI